MAGLAAETAMDVSVAAVVPDVVALPELPPQPVKYKQAASAMTNVLIRDASVCLTWWVLSDHNILVRTPRIAE